MIRTKVLAHWASEKELYKETLALLEDEEGMVMVVHNFPAESDESRVIREVEYFDNLKALREDKSPEGMEVKHLMEDKGMDIHTIKSFYYPDEVYEQNEEDKRSNYRQYEY